MCSTTKVKSRDTKIPNIKAHRVVDNESEKEHTDARRSERERERKKHKLFKYMCQLG